MIPLLYLVGAIVIVGALLWGLEQLPGDPTLKTIARVILIVALVIFAVIVIINMAAGFFGGASLGLPWKR